MDIRQHLQEALKQFVDVGACLLWRTLFYVSRLHLRFQNIMWLHRYIIKHYAHLVIEYFQGMRIAYLLHLLFVLAIELIQVTIDTLHINDRTCVFKQVIGRLKLAHRVHQSCYHQRPEEFTLDFIEPDLIK